jgi:hypothetical protein
MWMEFKDMAQYPLIRREPVYASCNRRPNEGLEIQKYSLYPKEHPANCPLRWRLSNGLGCISHDCKLDLVTIQGNLTGDQYIRDVLQPVVVPHLDNHPLATYGWQHQASSFKSSNRLPPKRSRDFCSLASHEPGFESHRAYLGHVRPSYTDSGTSCAKYSSVGRALHREWQQLSQQDIRRLTGGMRRRVEAVIQALGGYTRYWTLNNRCRQVIHKWRFESEMTILSCFLNCEGQYLKWTCFTAKTGLVILWLNIH